MTTQEIRKIVMGTFQKERKNPNAPVKSAHFLHAIELRFAICFKNSDFNRHYNINQLVEKVKARIENPQGNKLIIRERVVDRKPYTVNAIVTFTYMLTIAYFKIHLVSVIATAAIGIVMWQLIRIHRKDKQHNQKLFNKLMKNNQSIQ